MGPPGPLLCAELLGELSRVVVQVGEHGAGLDKAPLAPGDGCTCRIWLCALGDRAEYGNVHIG